MTHQAYNYSYIYIHYDYTFSYVVWECNWLKLRNWWDRSQLLHVQVNCFAILEGIEVCSYLNEIPVSV